MKISRFGAVLISLSIIAIAAVFFVVSSIMGGFNRLAGGVGDLRDDLGTQVAAVLHPTPTLLPDPVTVIHEMRSLARLETMQYTMEKIITAEIGQGAFAFLLGDRLLFVAHGEVIAGIDMQKMVPEDMRVEDNVLYVTLPPAEIFTAALDNELSYVYDRETGLFNKGNVELETLARQKAEEEILKAAIESGILEQAQTNAENFLWRLLHDLGFSEIIFVTPTPSPAPVRTPTATP
jgi:hypothetical protein